MIQRPTPKQNAPALSTPLLGGGEWNLANETAEHFTLVVFYRGLHCPLCKKNLQQLEELHDLFEEKGVSVIAISMDTEKRARLSRQKWELSKVSIGFGLDKEVAKELGLYLSEGVKEGEPAIFSEPGLFLVDKDHKIYYASMNSNPWGRPYLPSFVKAVDYIIRAGYPARGEVME